MIRYVLKPKTTIELTVLLITLDASKRSGILMKYAHYQVLDGTWLPLEAWKFTGSIPEMKYVAKR